MYAIGGTKEPADKPIGVTTVEQVLGILVAEISKCNLISCSMTYEAMSGTIFRV